MVRLGPAIRCVYERAEAVFQSHFGSIGAWRLHQHASAPTAYFNPTLVRLGPVQLVRGLAALLDFNPTLVRLGRLEYRDYHFLLPRFQSHFGSIGASLIARTLPSFMLISIPLWFDWGGDRPGWAARAAEADFNPTLVRLGRASHQVIPGPCRAFQSHFGSIGASVGWPRASAATMISIPLWFDWGCLYYCPVRSVCPHFNPTLVRLGPAPERTPCSCYGRFQSHFGSIGAEAPSSAPPLADRFQSHFGSIGARGDCVTSPANSTISIPLWFDWGLTVGTGCQGRGDVHFNPTLVRLGRQMSTPSSQM